MDRLIDCPVCGRYALAEWLELAARKERHPIRVRVRRLGGYRSASWTDVEPTAAERALLRAALLGALARGWPPGGAP